MNIIQELIEIIERKNSWGKNELLRELLTLLAAAHKPPQYSSPPPKGSSHD